MGLFDSLASAIAAPLSNIGAGKRTAAESQAATIQTAIQTRSAATLAAENRKTYIIIGGIVVVLIIAVFIGLAIYKRRNR